MFKGMALTIVETCTKECVNQNLYHDFWPALFGVLRTPPFVNHKGKEVNSDWFVGQLDERSVLGQAQISKGRMGDDPKVDTAQTQSACTRLALLGKSKRLSLIVCPTK